MKRFTICLYLLILLASLLRICFCGNLSKTSINGPQSNSPKKDEYIVFIELDENKLYFFNNKTLVKSYSIASGTLETPSPVGIWKVKTKSKWGEGFGGSWMGLDVPWGVYGIHGTIADWSIGHNTSHGCIRMHNEDAEELYNLIEIGTQVAVSKGPFGAIGTIKRSIIPGNRGSDVLAIQRTLKKFGFYKGDLDGIYGETMKKSLFKFQESKNIKPHNEITTYDLKQMGIFPFE